MSKKFEEEYKEYLNAQAPDLWSRIEAGIDTSSVLAKKRKKRKKQIRYQHYRALVSVAACLFALVIIVPVYLLVKPSGKGAAATDSAAPMVLTDATIENIEVVAEQSTVATEEAAVEESAAGDTEEIEVAESESEECVTELVEVAQNETGTPDVQGIDTTGVASEAPDGSTVASEELLVIPEEETEGKEAVQEQPEEAVAAQEEMNVVILSDGMTQEGGVLYTAALADSTSSATIGLFVPTGSGIVFEKDKTYTITVEQMTDGNYKVVVCFA